MLEGREREHSRAAERSLIIECTIAIEPLADFDSPKMPPEELDAQVAGNTRTGISKFLRSLLHLKSGWWANNALQRPAIALWLQTTRLVGRVADLSKPISMCL